MGLEPTTLRVKESRWIWCVGVCTITIALPYSSDLYDAWEEWGDKFDQTRTHSSFKDALLEPRFDRRTLVFIFRDHFVLDELCSNISEIQKKKHLFLYACKSFFMIGQRCRGLESENFNCMASIFLLREYLFWLVVFATILFIWCPASSVGRAWDS